MKGVGATNMAGALAIFSVFPKHQRQSSKPLAEMSAKNRLFTMLDKVWLSLTTTGSNLQDRQTKHRKWRRFGVHEAI